MSAVELGAYDAEQAFAEGWKGTEPRYNEKLAHRLSLDELWLYIDAFKLRMAELLRGKR